jgi:hypothetical protein
MLEHFTSGISEVNFISHVGLLQCCRRVARSGQFFFGVARGSPYRTTDTRRRYIEIPWHIEG